MSRASRRARGRQIEARLSGQPPAEALSAGTLQVGPLLLNNRDGSVTINAGKLDPPTQVYDADFGWVEYQPGRLSVIFGKRSLSGGDALETRLEVRYPPEDFLNSFWRNSVEFFGKLGKYVALWPKEVLNIPDAEPSRPAARAHSVWASFTYIAHSGSEASLDFYHMSPPAIARYAQTGSTEGIRLTPVTRVQMTTFELYRLLGQTESLVPQIEHHVPAIHPRAPMKETE